LLWEEIMAHRTLFRSFFFLSSCTWFSGETLNIPTSSSVRSMSLLSSCTGAGCGLYLAFCVFQPGQSFFPCLLAHNFRPYQALIIYLSTLANSTLNILFSKMLKFVEIISSKSKNIVEESSEYLGIFYLLKWKFQNELIVWQTCVEMAKVLL
jgi:hypothetical protein